MASNRISAEEVNARALAGEPMVFVDARNAKAWAESNRKIPGAIRVRADAAESHLNKIDKTATVIVYCTCPSEESSERVARTLSDNGHPRVFALRGGFDAWVAAEYPVETKPKAA